MLKTDDDAFVNVPPLLRLLGSLCETRDCSAERLYIGRMIQESEVLLAPGHKWNNAVFYNHTGVSRESVFFFFNAPTRDDETLTFFFPASPSSLNF